MFFLTILFCLFNFFLNVCHTNPLNLQNIIKLYTHAHVQYSLHNNYTITHNFTYNTLTQIKRNLVSLLKLLTHLPLQSKLCLYKDRTNVFILNQLVCDCLRSLKTLKYIRLHNSYFTLISASLSYAFSIVYFKKPINCDNYVFFSVILLVVEDRAQYVYVNNLEPELRLIYLYYG